MGRLVGIIRLDGGPIDRSLIERWRKPAGEFRPDRVRAEDNWAFAQQTLPFRRGDSAEPQPFRAADDALTFVEARLDDRATLRAKLGFGGRRPSDEAMVAGTVERGGLGAAESLNGDFSLIHWDPETRTLSLMRDILGQRGLYYHVDGPVVRFATSFHLLLALPEVPREIDDLGLVDSLLGASEAPDRTAWRGIKRVPAGCVVTLTADAIRTRRYWSAEALPKVRFSRDDDYVEAARELLDKAVASRLPEQGLLATTLSGGFDSAALTATAARLLGERRLTAYTRVSGAPHPYRGALDDHAFAAMVAAQHDNIDWVVLDQLYQAPRDTGSEWESARMGMPTNAFARSWNEPIHNAATAQGARTLFVGYMGNATLSWSGFGLAYEQVRQGRLIAAARDVIATARAEGRPIAQELKLTLGAAIEPGALRQWRRRRSSTHRWPNQGWMALSPDFLQSIDYAAHMDSVEHRNLDSVALPGRTLRASLLVGEARLDQYAYLRGEWSFEMLDPYTDRRLVEFTLGLPESQFARRGTRRWLARRALADRLPAELLAQTRRGRQIGEWYHLASLRREQTIQAVERIAKSPLASRVLDVPRLQRLVNDWPKDAEAARASEGGHRVALHQGVVIGSFLCWYEGNNG
ncbi:hypothetical protein DMC47_40005 [Nostoc sp. 3335mG]|nr:hypothetical protein DMC47_40005 [Nostoc sp. 3335mG]